MGFFLLTTRGKGVWGSHFSLQADQFAVFDGSSDFCENSRENGILELMGFLVPRVSFWYLFGIFWVSFGYLFGIFWVSLEYLGRSLEDLWRIFGGSFGYLSGIFRVSLEDLLGIWVSF